MNTFGSLARLWMRRRSLGVMSTTWMKMDVSGVVVENAGYYILHSTLSQTTL
jgi:hypothetical protein